MSRGRRRDSFAGGSGIPLAYPIDDYSSQHYSKPPVAYYNTNPLPLRVRSVSVDRSTPTRGLNVTVNGVNISSLHRRNTSRRDSTDSSRYGWEHAERLRRQEQEMYDRRAQEQEMYDRAREQEMYDRARAQEQKEAAMREKAHRIAEINEARRLATENMNYGQPPTSSRPSRTKQGGHKRGNSSFQPAARDPHHDPREHGTREYEPEIRLPPLIQCAETLAYHLKKGINSRCRFGQKDDYYYVKDDYYYVKFDHLEPGEIASFETSLSMMRVGTTFKMTPVGSFDITSSKLRYSTIPDDHVMILALKLNYLGKILEVDIIFPEAVYPRRSPSPSPPSSPPQKFTKPQLSQKHRSKSGRGRSGNRDLRDEYDHNETSQPAAPKPPKAKPMSFRSKTRQRDPPYDDKHHTSSRSRAKSPAYNPEAFTPPKQNPPPVYDDTHANQGTSSRDHQQKYSQTGGHHPDPHFQSKSGTAEASHNIPLRPAAAKPNAEKALISDMIRFILKDDITVARVDTSKATKKNNSGATTWENFVVFSQNPIAEHLAERWYDSAELVTFGKQMDKNDNITVEFVKVDQGLHDISATQKCIKMYAEWTEKDSTSRYLNNVYFSVVFPV